MDHFIERETVNLDPNKVRRYQTPLDSVGLQLTLYHDNGAYWEMPEITYAELSLVGFPHRCVVRSWHNRRDAKAEFPGLVDKFRRGEYHLSIHDNGKLQVELVPASPPTCIISRTESV